MRHRRNDNLTVRNNDGTKSKDIRAAVKDYLIENAYDRYWIPCSSTATFIERIAHISQAQRHHGS